MGFLLLTAAIRSPRPPFLLLTAAIRSPRPPLPVLMAAIRPSRLVVLLLLRVMAPSRLPPRQFCWRSRPFSSPSLRDVDKSVLHSLSNPRPPKMIFFYLDFIIQVAGLCDRCGTIL